MLLDMPETRPGFYAANLTASGRLAVRPRPSMVLRYEACGGLFNQVCGSYSDAAPSHEPYCHPDPHCHADKGLRTA